MRSKRLWVLVSLAVPVAFLLGVGAFLVYRTGTGAGWPRSLGQGIAKLEGIQWLLSRLDIGQPDRQAAVVQLLKRGSALEEEERYQEALQAYEEALEISPDESTVYLGLASAYEGLGEAERALAQLEKAAELAPEDANIQRHLGRLQCISGDYEACIQTLQKAVEIEPDDAWGRYWLGLAYQHGAEDGLDKALVEYQKALRVDPRLGKAHLALGLLLRDTPGQEVLAIEEVKKALDAALEAGDEELAAKAHAELASLYYARDEYDRCVEQWKQVLETTPDDADAHRRLGLCYAMRRGTGDLESAVQEMETALALDFDHMDAYYFYLGQYYATQKDYPRAIFAWDQFLRFSDSEELNAEVRGWIRSYQEALTEEQEP